MATLLKELQTELQMGEEMGRHIWVALDYRHFKPDDQPGLEEYMEQVIRQAQQPLGFMIFKT